MLSKILILTISPSYKWNCMKVKVFYANHLWAHLKTHIIEKSNKCNQCGFTSILAGNLMQHLKHTQRGRGVSKWWKRLLLKNIAHYGSFQHCTWLYLALPLSAMTYLTIDCHRLKCFCNTEVLYIQA